MMTVKSARPNQRAYGNDRDVDLDVMVHVVAMWSSVDILIAICKCKRAYKPLGQDMLLRLMDLG